MSPLGRRGFYALIAVLAARVCAEQAADRCEAVQGSALLQRSSTLERSPVLSQRSAAASETNGTYSFAVFTRVIAQELPYLTSFVQHYKRLGVHKFYMLSNVQSDIHKIEAYLDKHNIDGVRYTFFFREGGADDILASEGLLNEISEDYIIGVDGDEFWSLPDSIDNMPELVRQSPADAYIAKWAMISNDHMLPNTMPPYGAFSGRKTKWMAKREALRDFTGIHVPRLRWNAGPPAVRWSGYTAETQAPGGWHIETQDVGRIVHFWGRSFIDVATKGIVQFFRDGSVYKDTSDRSGAYHGCEGLNRTIELVENGNLPERLKVLALMTLHPVTEVVNPPHEMLIIDRDQEQANLNSILSSHSSHLIGILQRNYEGFKECLKEYVQKYPQKFDLNPKGQADWLETLSCGTVGSPARLLA